jgi:hypothetical protein
MPLSSDLIVVQKLPPTKYVGFCFQGQMAQKLSGGSFYYRNFDLVTFGFDEDFFFVDFTYR